MKIVSYFSYKGGAGRTTLAYNTIPLLLNNHIKPTKEAPVILMDMDIDSCGMSYLLNIPADQIANNRCVQYLLGEDFDYDDCDNISDTPVLKDMFPVGNKLGYADNEAVLFLPAKDLRNVHSKKSDNYNLEKAQERIGLFIEVCEDLGVPAILLDSAVGHQAAALLANRIADTIVCCMRPTTQFVEGTFRYLEKQDANDATIPGRKKCVLVPNVVPQETTWIDDHEYPLYAYDTMHRIFDPLTKNRGSNANWQYNTAMLNDGAEEFGIPAVASFMWREGQLYTQKTLEPDEKLALERYEKLAGIIWNP